MDARDPATQLPWQRMLGIEFSPVSHRERLISALGGFVALLLVFALSRSLLDAGAAPILMLSIEIGRANV